MATTTTINWDVLADRLAIPGGGFTVDLSTGFDARHGFAVGTYVHRSWESTATEVSADTVRTYAALNADLLEHAGNVLGGWHDPATGRVWLDVSRVTADLAEALQWALANNQISIFNLDRGETVDVGGNGHVAEEGSTTVHASAADNDLDWW